MTQTLSHKFIAELEQPRNRLYAAALAHAGTPAAAEALLQQTARTLFGQYAKDALPDIPGSMARALEQGGGTNGVAVNGAAVNGSAAGGGGGGADVPMPADVWARLAATVQIEAAQSSNSKALNPDSVLLRPDPLLAPKKAAPRDDHGNFDLASPSRLMFAGGIAVLVGIVITIYIIARPSPVQKPVPHVSGSTMPASAPATTMPTSAP